MERFQARFGRSAASIGVALVGILFLRTALTTFRTETADVAAVLLFAATGVGYLVAAWAVRPDVERVETRILAAGLTAAAAAHALRLVEAFRAPVFTWTLFVTALLVLTLATLVAAVGAWLGAPERRHAVREGLVRLGFVASAVGFALYVAANVELGRDPLWSILLGDFAIRALAALVAAWGYFEADPPVAPAPADDAPAPA